MVLSKWSGLVSGIAVVCFLAALADSTDAAILTVAPDGSGDYPTIQAAIDAAADSDQIALLDGTFSGAGNRNIDFRGKSLILRSESGDPSACILDFSDGEMPSRGLLFVSNEDRINLVLDLTLTGARSEGAGGAVYVESGRVAFGNVRFSDNKGEGGSVALIADAISVDFDSCWFMGNEGEAAVLVERVLEENRSEISFDDCFFRDQTQGCIRTFGEDVDLILRTCSFRENQGWPVSIRGGETHGTTRIENCQFIRNENAIQLRVSEDDSIDFEVFHSRFDDSGRISLYGGRSSRFTDCSFSGGGEMVSRRGQGTSLIEIDGIHSTAIENSQFLGNSGRLGYVCGDCVFQLSDCELIGNEDLFFVDEGINFRRLRIDGCWIEGSTGTGIVVDAHATVELTDTVFYDNTSPDAIIDARAHNAEIEVDHCSFVSNEVPEGHVVVVEGTLKMSNTIIAFADGPSLGFDKDVPMAPGLRIENTVIYGNSGGDWEHEFLEALVGRHCNRSIDPGFCDLDGGDLRLWEKSPLIAAAALSCPELPGALGPGCDDNANAKANPNANPNPNPNPNPNANGPGGDRATALGAGSDRSLQLNPIRDVEGGWIFHLELATAGSVRLDLFDIAGRRLRSLQSAGSFDPGRHEVHWDGRDQNGDRVSTGVYFLRLQSGEASLSRSIVHLRR